MDISSLSLSQDDLQTIILAVEFSISYLQDGLSQLPRSERKEKLATIRSLQVMQSDIEKAHIQENYIRNIILCLECCISMCGDLLDDGISSSEDRNNIVDLYKKSNRLEVRLRREFEYSAHLFD